MTKILKTLGLGFLVLIAYLLFWPVPVSPVTWTAPENPGYTGVYAPNDILKNLETISIGDQTGPEDVAARMEDGKMVLYAAVHSGQVLKIWPEENRREVFADTGGRPLGMEFDRNGNLIVADAYKGLLSISPNGKVTVLADKLSDGGAIGYPDDLDIADDGRIFFSDASTKFGPGSWGDTLAASLLDIMEHGAHGRLLIHDPATGKTTIAADGLNFANGVAVCPDQTCVLVNETGSYRVRRLWLTGNKAGEMDTILDNLPGFPDNLNRGPDGRIWLGLVSPRSAALDKLSGQPFLRRIVQRLPAAMRPKARNYGFVIALDQNGIISTTLQDPDGGYPLTTGAVEPGDGWLYITSLGAPTLGRLPLSALPKP